MTNERLFNTLTLKSGNVLENRIAMAPMTTWSSNDDYTISDEEVAYYEKRVNDVGLVITGCTHVQENGIGFTNEYAAYDDKFIPSLKKLATAAKSGGHPAYMQIFHAGNKALAHLIPNGDVVSSSAVVCEASGFAPETHPRALSIEEVHEVIKAFGETARRAIEAGFDGVELHGAHGFLIQNFLSPHFNKREDEFGGSLENRLRFALAIVDEIKTVIAKHANRPFGIGFRISPDEHYEDGLTIEDTLALTDALIEKEIDYIHISLSHAVSAKAKNEANDYTLVKRFAQHINGKIPLMAAGMIMTPEEMNKLMDQGLDITAVGHGLVINPNFVELVQNNQSEQLTDTIDLSNKADYVIPEKLWGIIENSGGWFKVK
ncbi:NADH-dependent flavin oxidoreductase [Macrococcus capreoli]|uniref:NADH-dependent flavin oxidoreductase n=1 Tax=Macrococcus capreoli TaxID=2982690 RepID=UPI0021D5F7B0|nr:NADH-dependent flavin oxidoreductase [Macrococcus sp. TMW 2.2395]MCU7557657.1 NADH-dependent flavin oxidoreductase [Macrococcus sp. TMW 2.2395]